MDEKIRHAILGNVGTLIAFRVGAADAAYLKKEFEPTFTEEDLVNQPRYGMYIKLMIDGATSRPFSASTLPKPALSNNQKRGVLDECKRRNAKFVSSQPILVSPSVEKEPSLFD